MNAQNSTETIVIPKFTNNPIDTVIKIRQVRARMIVCPAMILDKQTDHQGERLGEYAEKLDKRHDWQRQFQIDRCFGQNISFQYSFVANRLTAINVHPAKTAVTAMLPVMLAPPGKTGMIPIRLLIRIKKKTVSR